MNLKSCNQKKTGYQICSVIYLTLSMLFSGCNSNSKTDLSQLLDEEEKIELEEILKIGVESQGEKYQFGDPIGVRTDSSHNIYVADRASLTIRMYDSEGSFIRDIGRRGRGPSEFLDINTFEITPEENFFVLDRGNWRYKHLTKKGIEVASIPIEQSGMEWFFFPDDIDHYEDKIIALFNDGVFNPEEPLIDKELFYVYDKELKNRKASFFEFSQLRDIEINTFSWLAFLGKPGSFILSQDKSEFYYSPAIYHGNIYCFRREGDSEWKLHKVIKANDFSQESYTSLENNLYERYRSKSVPGLTSLMFGGAPDPHTGRVNTFDAGIHQLSDGRIIVFAATWRDPLDKGGEHENMIDVYAQIINNDYSVHPIGLVKSVEATQMPWKPLVNWKDSEDNFYLLENSDLEYPSVTKFRIEQIRLGHGSQRVQN